MATELATRRGGRNTKTWLVTGAVACVLALVATLLVVLRGAAGTDPFARLRPLDPRVEVRAAGEGDYALGTTDQQLQVGDTVRTDPQGRGEIAYHEGSLTRLGPDAVFELAELTDAPALHLRLEAGQLWQRVARLTGTEGSFRLHTPAATATVAGTVFAADCTEEGACTFTVIEGRLHLTTTTGEELTLEAGEQVTIAPGGTPGETEQLIEDDLWADEWIGYNLERDGATPTGTSEPEPQPTPTSEVAMEARTLVLEDEGIGVLTVSDDRPEPSVTQRFLFGSPLDEVTVGMERWIGPADERGVWDCYPLGRFHFARWGEFHIAAYLDETTFEYYFTESASVPSGITLRTAEGIGVGSSVAELREAYGSALTLEESEPDPDVYFFVENFVGARGHVSGYGDTEVVMDIESGNTGCAP